MLVVVGLSTALAAAPACNEVLLSSISSSVSISAVTKADVEKTIEDLAKLKLEIDLAKMQGEASYSLPMNNLSADYQAKYRRLLIEASDYLDGKTLKEEITKKISKLQNEVHEHRESSRIEAQTQRERDATPSLVKNFKLKKKRIQVPTSGEFKLGEMYLVYLEQENSVLYWTKYHSVRMLNLTTGSERELFTGVELVRVSENKEEISVIKKDRFKNHYFFETYKVSDMGKVQSRFLKFGKHPPLDPLSDFEISPTGRDVLIREEGTALPSYHLFDLSSGERIPWQGIKGYVTPKGKAGFISENEIFFSVPNFAANDNILLLRYNTNTGAQKFAANQYPAVSQVVISREQAQISFVVDAEVISMDRDLNEVLRRKIRADDKFLKTSFKPGISDLNSEYMVYHRANEIEIINQLSLESVFNFEHHYSLVKLPTNEDKLSPLAVSFGESRQSVVVFYQTLNYKDGKYHFFIDLWKSK